MGSSFIWSAGFSWKEWTKNGGNNELTGTKNLFFSQLFYQKKNVHILCFYNKRCILFITRRWKYISVGNKFYTLQKWTLRTEWTVWCLHAWRPCIYSKNQRSHLTLNRNGTFLITKTRFEKFEAKLNEQVHPLHLNLFPKWWTLICNLTIIKHNEI